MKKRILTLVLALATTTIMFGCGSKEEETTVEELQAQVEALETELAEVKENVNIVDETEVEEKKMPTEIPIEIPLNEEIATVGANGSYYKVLSVDTVNIDGKHQIWVKLPDKNLYAFNLLDELDVENGIALTATFSYLDFEDYSTWWISEVEWHESVFLSGENDWSNNYLMEMYN